MLRTSRGPQSSWAPKERCSAKRTWITSVASSKDSEVGVSAIALILAVSIAVDFDGLEAFDVVDGLGKVVRKAAQVLLWG